MGDRLRLRASNGAGAGSAARFARLVGIVARLVQKATTPRQKLDEVLARGAQRADPAGARRVLDFAAIRCAFRYGAAPAAVVAASVGEDSAHESSACLAVVCGTASNAGATGTEARGDADTVRMCRRRGFAESRADCARIHATLCSRALRRRALRYNALARVARPGSRGIARTLI